MRVKNLFYLITFIILCNLLFINYILHRWQLIILNNIFIFMKVLYFLLLFYCMLYLLFIIIFHHLLHHENNRAFQIKLHMFLFIIINHFIINIIIFVSGLLAIL
jgi:hypothetical protein